MFGTVVDKLQTLLSRNFLIAVYFPVLIFAGACFAMSCLAFPAAATVLWAWWKSGLTTQVQHLVIALLTVAIVAYTFAPLTVLFRRALQMDFTWIAWLAHPMGQMELERAGVLTARTKASAHYSFLLEQYITGLLASLPRSRMKGVSLKALQDTQAIDTASNRIEALALERRKPQFSLDPKFSSLRLTAKHLSNALDRNSADIADPRSIRLQAAYLKFRDECLDMVAVARFEAGRCAEAQYARFPRTNIRPTRFANIRSVAESYATHTYGVDYDYLWPRLKFVLAKDDKASDILDAAQNQLDYSILLLGLAVVFFLLWLPLLCFVGAPVWLFLCTGFAAPLVVSLLYAMVIDNQGTMGSVIRATVDRFRLDVLASLSQAPPTTLMLERQRWAQVQRATSAEGLLDLPLNVTPK